MKSRKIGQFKGQEIRIYRPEDDKENEERVVLLDGIEIAKIYMGYARDTGWGWSRGHGGIATHKSMIDAARDMLRRREW